MNGAHLHLMLNHVPVIGVPLAAAVLAAGYLRKSDEWKRAALWIFFAVALLGAAAYFTGEPAEEKIEHMPGISKHRIEEHEESALPSLIVAALAGLVSVAGLAMGRGKPLPGWAPALALVLGIAAALLLARTANLGGQIHHPEIRAADTTSGGEREADD